jgi:hypothetical protein
MRLPRALLLASTAALAAATVLRLPAAWASGNALNHVSGAWIALAEDLAHGTFYRPLHDAGLGYGGTRFFPLAFALHAALRTTGADLIASGYAVSLAAGALLAVALFLLVRTTGLARPAAAAFAVLGFAAFAAQHALASVRGDLLPVALSALGLAAVAWAPARGRGAALGALLFALAFAAKPTALTAPAAAAAWLLLRGERRLALGLTLLTGAGAVAVVLVTDVLSQGRFLAILAATATGGAGGGDLLRGPIRLAEHLLIADPAAIVLAGGATLVALAGLPARVRAARAGPPDPALLASLWLLAAGGGALVVFGSPGTGVNHLVELEAAAAAALGTAWAGAGRPARLARALAPAAALAGVLVAFGMAREDGRTARMAEARQVAAALPARGRVLSEDPLIPLAAGRRPEVLDPWMLRLASEANPVLARPLLDDLRAGKFDAVVLFHDLDSPVAGPWYARGNLGPAVVEAIRAGYHLAERRGRYRIYLPTAADGAHAHPDPLASARARE